MKRSYVIAGVLAAVSILWVVSGQFKEKKETPGAGLKAVAGGQKTLPQVRVHTYSAQKKVNELVLFGRTEAVRTVRLKAETAGRVVDVAVEKGRRVPRGEVIVRLAMDDREARLAEAEAVLDEKTIAYQAARQLSKMNYRSKVKLAESKAELETARAALKKIKLDRERTGIEAPFEGIVNDLPVEIGDYIALGDVVAKIVDLDPILVVGEVAERDAAKLTLGAPVLVRLGGGREATGKLSYVSKVGAVSTRTFRIEVALANPGGELSEGLTTELVLPLGSEMAQKVSPAILTLSDEGVVGVKAIEKGDVVRFYPVRLVADEKDGVWLSGLPETVTLITVGQEFVKPGGKVRALFDKGAGRP
ncbi:MAG TPA: efflux RND transporter periplasmic adaptor subunit [Rhodospirillales bacterium]|nr:efflux RND transporter periplasmic adaptor subunit [Rhodospirillales bacterium]